MTAPWWRGCHRQHQWCQWQSGTDGATATGCTTHLMMGGPFGWWVEKKRRGKGEERKKRKGEERKKKKGEEEEGRKEKERKKRSKGKMCRC